MSSTSLRRLVEDPRVVPELSHRQQMATLLNAIIEGKNAMISGESGEGIRVGALGDNDFGWRDILGQIKTTGNPAFDPSWTQIGSGPFYAWAFALNDECWIPFHIPHDIVPGTDIYFHTHWLTDGTSTASVKWQYTYTFAKGFNQEAFDSSGTTVTAEEAASGTAYQHMVTETAAVSISGLTEPDGIIYVNVERITNGGTNNTDTVFMLLSDVHYQSTNIATENKAPNFYGV